MCFPRLVLVMDSRVLVEYARVVFSLYSAPVDVGVGVIWSRSVSLSVVPWVGVTYSVGRVAVGAT